MRRNPKPSRSTRRESGERVILHRIRDIQSRNSFACLALGIGDDCALLEQKPGEQVVVTTDLSIEGRHFRLESYPPEAVGHRTLARGLSDLAAMGARPLAAFLSVGLPAELTRSRGRSASWIDRFFDGFFALANQHKTPLAGGDLAQAATAVADIVLIGRSREGELCCVPVPKLETRCMSLARWAERPRVATSWRSSKRRAAKALGLERYRSEWRP